MRKKRTMFNTIATNQVGDGDSQVASHFPVPAFWRNPPLLRSERAADFDALLRAFIDEIKPQGVIEQMYVNEIACLVWDILRWRRCKPVIIKLASHSAIKKIIEVTMSR